MKYPYWKIKGITCGSLESEEDFVVREIIGPKFLRKFARIGNAVKRIEGPYTLYIMKKCGITTHKAVATIAEEFKIPQEAIGYAGLKDKFAVTTQYVTIKNCSEEMESDDLSLKIAGKTDRHIGVGDLLGNGFEITLHGCKDVAKNFSKSMASSGFANFFGPQRFGSAGNNHEAGKAIVKKDFSGALDIINKMYLKNFRDIRKVPKQRLKFFINSYQSWLFNQALQKCVLDDDVPRVLEIPGCRSVLKNKNAIYVMKKEGVRSEDFMVRELSISCRGSVRQAVVKTDVSVEKMPGATKFIFYLPRGSYATTLLSNV